MEKLVARHLVEDDEGAQFVVLEFQEFTESRALGRASEWLPGLKRLALESGAPVNFRSEGQFETLDGRALRKIG